MPKSSTKDSCVTMSDSEVCMLAAAAFLLTKPTPKVRKIVRRYHVRPSLQARKIYSAEDLLRDLQLDDTHHITNEVTLADYQK